MCDSAKMEVYLNPVKYCKTPTGHPKGHPCCKIADYDDTALGTGTLTVHPWRAGPDCGKLLYSEKTTKFKEISLLVLILLSYFNLDPKH